MENAGGKERRMNGIVFLLHSLKVSHPTNHVVCLFDDKCESLSKSYILQLLFDPNPTISLGAERGDILLIGCCVISLLSSSLFPPPQGSVRQCPAEKRGVRASAAAVKTNGNCVSHPHTPHTTTTLRTAALSLYRNTAAGGGGVWRGDLSVCVPLDWRKRRGAFHERGKPEGEGEGGGAKKGKEAAISCVRGETGGSEEARPLGQTKNV